MEQGWTDATLDGLARRFLDAADDETQRQFIDFLLDVQRSENPDDEAGTAFRAAPAAMPTTAPPGHDRDPNAT
ncbi:hypothetical protein BDK92_2628 [Micromonospora pisi]|uniref:Uncharacterized protein n=1 Tax=Micromonospora pisi TaxID=589240 RepID=A0A495JHE8_9ACTN|nr:hypothetical protein [Micromonospora pisi]RKR88317.1 hypothetical protein BDK92_2628 [Micromonospora pisi]